MKVNNLSNNYRQVFEHLIYAIIYILNLNLTIKI